MEHHIRQIILQKVKSIKSEGSDRHSATDDCNSAENILSAITKI
jgi:hypothetical protein